MQGRLTDRRRSQTIDVMSCCFRQIERHARQERFRCDRFGDDATRLKGRPGLGLRDWLLCQPQRTLTTRSRSQDRGGRRTFKTLRESRVPNGGRETARVP